MLERLTLKGKVAIVSGAGGGGIGTQTSLALAEAGANIIAIDISEERAKETEKLVKALGRDCLPIAADLTKKTEIQKIVAAGVKKFGAIHCVANVAGGMKPGQWANFETFTEANWDDVYNMNLRYIFLMCQAVGMQMIGKDIRGTMCSVVSVSGLNGAPYHSAYGAAKAGLISLTKSMAGELGRYGIRVNAVVPGAVKTPRAVANNPMDMDERLAVNIPIGRACTPDEIAAGILFMLSPLSSAVSGHALVIDGAASSHAPLRGRYEELQPARNKWKQAPRP